MSILTCHLCGLEQDATGPAVEANHDDAGWRFMWVPFIEDMRATPARLMHPTCFVEEYGADSLLAAVVLNDHRVRKQLALARRG